MCLQEAGEKAERSYLNGLLYIHRLKLHSTQETLFIIIIIIIIDYKIKKIQPNFFHWKIK
jgi:hypothetical protein